MITETIKEIKETELQAEEIIKNANAKCVEMAGNASEEAKQLKYDAYKKAMVKAKAEMEQTIQQGQADIEKALTDVGIQVNVLKQSSGTKIDEAVKAVIEALV